jgi:organic hydroperoxide reductase OsmC/OhrA
MVDSCVNFVDGRRGRQTLQLKNRGLRLHGFGHLHALWDTVRGQTSSEADWRAVFISFLVWTGAVPEPVIFERMRQHRYEVTNRWTGNLGTGTSNYRAYSRNHELSTPAKSAPVLGSSDPLFRGDRSRYNPEELLVGALSACHMLWALHYCADAGIVVVEYVDVALGEMPEHPDGSGEFSRVVLRPRMTISDRTRIEDAIAIHARVHDVCAIARSVNFPVLCEPAVTAEGSPS